MTLKNSSDISTETLKLKCLIYGKSGTFKTPFACSFPKPVIFDMDKGMLSVRKMGVPYHCFADLNKTMVWPAMMEAARKEAKNPERETLILDSLTTAAESALTYTQYVTNRLGKKPNWDDWGGQVDRLAEYLDLVFNSNKHVVVTAHETARVDAANDKIWIGPLFTGKAAERLPLYFDEVYHSEGVIGGDKKVKYMLLCKPTEIYTAKSRLLENEIYLPADFNKIMELVKAGEKLK